MERIIKSSSSEKGIILDFYSGSGSTVCTTLKIKNRKFIGVEMGEHFHSRILPRVKQDLFNGRRTVIAKENDYLGGGFVKYFELEQYEEALTKVRYEDKGSLPTQDIYHQYLFLKDLKLADYVIKLDDESKNIKVDLTKLHPAIDIPETLSHLTGKFIKQIKKDEVVFTDGTSIDLTNIDYKIVKPLIWW
jgi:adenine specific DNA methylase Mod